MRHHPLRTGHFGLLNLLVRNYTCAVTTALVFAFSVSASWAQIPDSISAESTISVLTVYAGDPVYSAWGHSALRVQDPESRIDAVFNWGTFDVTRPNFIPRFVYGDMLYQLSIEPMTRFMRGADAEQRDVVEQILNLSPQAIHEMWGLLKENLKEDNRSYQYDFVLDNCSTRLVDLLEATNSISLGEDRYVHTYRDMIDEYVHKRSWLDLGIDLVFGSLMDDTPDLRTRTFLPIYLMQILDDASGSNGAPLVREKRTLAEYGNDRSQAGLPWTVPLFWVLSASLMAMTIKGLRDKSLTAPARLDQWLLGVTGFMGLFLAGMWFVTQHWVTALNWNVGWLLPTHLAAAIVWSKWSGLRTYLRYSSYVMGIVLVLQIFLVQPIPPAMLPVAAALTFRFWGVSR